MSIKTVQQQFEPINLTRNFIPVFSYVHFSILGALDTFPLILSDERTRYVISTNRKSSAFSFTES